MAERALSRYHGILEGECRARYLDVKATGRLREKVLAGKRMLTDCRLCERACGANRSSGEPGHCGVTVPRISSEFLHMGEEPDLVPSYTVFFSGCTFHCVFCQNWDISTHPESGDEIAPIEMARKIELRTDSNGIQHEKAKNVNWVGGEPTPNLPYVLEVLNECKANLPQVWNSNMYMSEEAMELLHGIVDVYLTDFKFGNDECAKRLSQVPEYTRVVRRNHLRARENGEMIIRHLVLPGHVECCTRPVLNWIAENLADVKVNVMSQYRPEFRAGNYPEIAHSLSMKEFEMAVGIASELGLDLVD